MPDQSLSVESFEEPAQGGDRRQKGMSPLVIAIIAGVTLLAVGGGVWYAMSGKKSDAANVEPASPVTDCEPSNTTAITKDKDCKCATDSKTNECKAPKFCLTTHECKDQAILPVEVKPCPGNDTQPVAVDCKCDPKSETVCLAEKKQYCWESPTPGECKNEKKPDEPKPDPPAPKVEKCDRSDDVTLQEECQCDDADKDTCKAKEYCWKTGKCSDVAKPGECHLRNDTVQLKEDCMCDPDDSEICKKGEFCWETKQCSDERKPDDVLPDAPGVVTFKFRSLQKDPIRYPNRKTTPIWGFEEGSAYLASGTAQSEYSPGDADEHTLRIKKADENRIRISVRQGGLRSGISDFSPCRLELDKTSPDGRVCEVTWDYKGIMRQDGVDCACYGFEKSMVVV